MDADCHLQLLAILEKWHSAGVLLRIENFPITEWYKNRQQFPGIFVSRTFCLRQDHGKYRLIADFRPPNQLMETHRFKMTTLQHILPILPVHGFLWQADIEEAYTHVGLKESIRKLLLLMINGEIYLPTVLLFGIAPAPQIFTKIVSVPLQTLHYLGIGVAAYIDDLTGWNRCPMAAFWGLTVSIRLFQLLGFRISWKKCVLEPTHCLQILGWMVDLREMRIYLPDSKMKKYRARLQRFVQMSDTTVRHAASILGTLQHMTFGIKFLRQLTVTLTNSYNDQLHVRDGFDNHFFVSPVIKNDILEILAHLRDWNGTTLLHRTYDLIQHADASGYAWGGNLSLPGGTLLRANDFHIHSTLLRQTLPLPNLPILEYQSLTPLIHICVLEALAQWETIYTLEQTAQLSLANKRLLLYSDNVATVACINKGGRSQNPQMAQLVMAFLSWARKKNLTIQAEWVPGSENSLADTDSRIVQTKHEWRLNPHIFQQIDQIWGPHSIDLFASAINAHLPTFCTRIPDPQALATNAFTIHWAPHNGWINPPFILLPDILQKVEIERATVTLLAPVWPNQPWYPQLLSLLIDFPILLPHRLGTFETSPYQTEPFVPFWRQTAIWRLSGLRSMQAVFRQKLFERQSQDGAIPNVFTEQTFNFGPGWSSGTWIPWSTQLFQWPSVFL